MVQRIRVEDLTPGERTGLAAQGREVPQSGFMDLEVRQPELVDPRAADRAKAAQALKSVAPAPRQEPAPASPKPEVVNAPTPVAVAKEVLTEPTPETKHPDNCPHCGWDMSKQLDHEPSKGEMAEFLRSVMAGELYTQRVSLFGGAVEVTFRTRTEIEDEGVRDALRYLIRSNKIENDRDLIARARRIHMAIGIKTLTLGGRDLEFQTAAEELGGKVRDGELFLELVDRRISRIPTQLLDAIYRLFDVFVDKNTTMTARAQDPGFWMGSARTP